MALGLLLAAGAGILGGTQYLMKKADEKENESLLNDFVGQASQTPFGQQYAGEIAQQAATPTGFFDAGQADRTRSLLNNYRNAEMQFAQGQAQLADQQQKRGFDLTEKIESDYNRDLKGFGQVIQPAFNKAMFALENPNSADSISSLYNFFNLIEPGGRVTANEDGSFSGIGGAASWFANKLNQWVGEGLTAVTRDQLLAAIWKQYRPEYEKAQRQKAQYEDDLKYYGERGYDVRSPVGRLGISWDSQQPTIGSGSELTPEEAERYAPLDERSWWDRAKEALY